MSDLCRLCRSSNTRLMFRKGGEPFYICLDCSFQFQIPAVNANLVAVHEEFEPAYVQYLEDSPEDELNYSELFGRLNLRPGQAVRTLDVGCGSGKFVRFLRNRSIDAYGIEPSAALYERYLSQHSFYWNTTVEALVGAEREGFDIITALDVVEHVERPKDFIACCAALLKPQGVILLSTPDVKSVPARLLGRRWHFYHKWHLSYFSRTVLESTLTSAGLTVRETGHIGRRRSVGYALQYGLNYILGLKSVGIPAALNKIAVPMNTFDVLYAFAEKNTKLDAVAI
jgi:2-polyprenyl-3-methyl-5-hydroxy-6-metoxy-1,4-benzoquinol methylase